MGLPASNAQEEDVSVAPITYNHNQKCTKWSWAAETIKESKTSEQKKATRVLLDSKMTACIQSLSSGGLKKQPMPVTGFPSWEAAVPSLIYIFNEQL